MVKDTVKPEERSIPAFAKAMAGKQAVKPKGLKVLSPVIPLIRGDDLVNSKGSQHKGTRKGKCSFVPSES